MACAWMGRAACSPGKSASPERTIREEPALRGGGEAQSKDTLENPPAQKGQFVKSLRLGGRRGS